MTKLIGALFLALISLSAFAGEQNPEWKTVQNILRREGIVQDETLKILFPRTDLSVQTGEFKMHPDFALSSWLGFKKVGRETMLMGDLVLLDAEVSPVLAKLVAIGFQVTALHNHFVGEKPTLKFMHFMGHGNASELAKKMKVLLQTTGTPMQASPPSDVVENPDWKTIEYTLGLTGRRKGSLLLFSVPRRETIRENGVDIPPIMGMASAIHFQPAGSSAMTAGDLIVLPSEVNRVVQALIKNGIEVTAFHNHTIFEEPRLFSVHFVGYGNPRKLANAVKTALNRTNSVVKSATFR